jgi:hypothetical protein
MHVRTSFKHKFAKAIHNGYKGSFPGANQSEHETDHSLSADVKVNMWSYTSTPLYIFIAWCLIKHREKCNHSPLSLTVIYDFILLLSLCIYVSFVVADQYIRFLLLELSAIKGFMLTKEAGTKYYV